MIKKSDVRKKDEVVVSCKQGEIAILGGKKLILYLRDQKTMH
jgi:hypothetical protein